MGFEGQHERDRDATGAEDDRASRPAGLQAELMDATRFLFTNLFDVRMSAVVTVPMLPIVYGLGILVAAGFTIGLVVHAFGSGVAGGLFWLIIAGPVVFVTAVALLRIFLEFLLAIFRISLQMDAVVQQTQEIAIDLPRLKFWKSFRGRHDNGP